MGLFDKKFCDICGEKIGLLGNKKLSDGNCCKDCVSKLSPWFSERKQSTVEQIRQQLAYREANKEEAAAFRTTLTLGEGNKKFYIDEKAGKFCVTGVSNIATGNPDILKLEDITGCKTEIQDSRSEIKRKDAQGNEVSYNPPRYEYDYDFYVTFNVNHPYFDEMRFQINGSDVEIEAMGSVVRPETNMQYRKYSQMLEDIKSYALDARNKVRDDIAAAAAPKTAVICPNCGASTIPSADGRCEYCGGAVFK